MTHPEQPSAVPEPSRGPVGRVVVLIPTYNERENLPRDRGAGAGRRTGRRRAGAGRQLPGRHRRRGRRARCRGRRRARAAPPRPRRGWAPPTSPGSAGRWTTGTTRWSRWTPTARTSPSSCRGCWRPSPGPTWSSAPGGCPAVQVVNWPLHRKVLSVGGNLYTRVLLGMPVGDATGGFRVYRAAALQGAGPARRRLAGLLLPGRPRLARRAPGADGPRGADHLRRA